MAEGHSILLGTTKGLFIVDGSAERVGWRVRGPMCSGWGINHAVGEAGSGRIWAAGGGDFLGAGVWRSADRGETWALTKLSRGQMDDWAGDDPEFAALFGWDGTAPAFGGAFSQVWSLCRSGGLLYAGVKPANLLRSSDNGVSWEMVEGLAAFPDRDSWSPGGAGLILHTIVPDPDDATKIWTGISAAGVFATEDGGATWERRNRMSNAEAACDHDHPAAPRDGETGHCVHNMVRAPGQGGDLLYQQNHHGVWRSRDGGRSWEDINSGLPSTFGFPIAVHPNDPERLWVIPLNGDTKGRFPPDAAAAVWTSNDGGDSWAARRRGLPQEACYFTVLRQAMAVDRDSTPGVYFGTNTGSVFFSRDEGESWEEIARHLPTILSLEVMGPG